MAPPTLKSMLSQPVTANNFIAMQSALMTQGTGNLAISIVFTLVPSTQRVTYKFSNTGTKAIYVCGSNSSSPIAAVVSTSTPMPTSTLISTSICDCIPAGAIITQDYPGGTNNISGICKTAENTTLEISIGGGQ